MRSSLAALLLVACGTEAIHTRDDMLRDADVARDGASSTSRSEHARAAAQDGRVPNSHEAPAGEASTQVPDGSSGDLHGNVRPTSRTSIVDHDRWWLLPANEDPFTDRLDDVLCTLTAVMSEVLAEERAYGVDTGLCNYLTAEQPARRQIAAGETIKVRLWHFELSAPESAEAHAAVWVDGIPILDERLPIPQPGGLLVREVKLTRDVLLDAPVHFHLHNHGANSWALVEVSAGP